MRTVALSIALASCTAQRPGSTYSREPNPLCAVERGERSTIVVADRSALAAPSAEFAPQVTPDPEYDEIIPADRRAATLPALNSPAEHPLNRPAVFWVVRSDVLANPRLFCARADVAPRLMPPRISVSVRFVGERGRTIRESFEIDWNERSDGRPFGPQWELHQQTRFSVFGRFRLSESTTSDLQRVNGPSAARWSGNFDGAVTFCPRILVAADDWRIALDRWFWTLESCERAIAR